MIRALVGSVGIAFFISALSWFAIPRATYVEDAMGILFLIFAVTTMLVFFALRIYSRRSPRV